MLEGNLLAVIDRWSARDMNDFHGPVLLAGAVWRTAITDRFGS
jgi:hypothetical protein